MYIKKNQILASDRKQVKYYLNIMGHYNSHTKHLKEIYIYIIKYIMKAMGYKETKPQMNAD